MKVLLDECVPKKLGRHLAGHDCHTVPELGLAGKKNGELLSIAEARGFEVFVSLDQGFEYQQNLRNRNLDVVLIRSRSNTLSSLIGDVGEILSAIETIQPGELIKVPRRERLGHPAFPSIRLCNRQ